MSNTADSEPGKVTATSSFAGTQLELLDGERHIIARGIERLEQEVRPGIYVVRASFGKPHDH